MIGPEKYADEIDPVAVDVALIDNDAAHVFADPKLVSEIFGDISIALVYSALNSRGAAASTAPANSTKTP